MIEAMSPALPNQCVCSLLRAPVLGPMTFSPTPTHNLLPQGLIPDIKVTQASQLQTWLALLLPILKRQGEEK